MTRHDLREHCFKILFSAEFYPPEEADEQIDNYFEQEEIKLNEAHASEVKERVKEIIPKLPEIDKKLSEVTEGWKLERIGKVELSILRLASFEILFDDNIPDKVAINEAVELGRQFSGDDAPAFINGVLAKLV